MLAAFMGRTSARSPNNRMCRNQRTRKRVISPLRPCLAANRLLRAERVWKQRDLASLIGVPIKVFSWTLFR